MNPRFSVRLTLIEVNTQGQELAQHEQLSLEYVSSDRQAIAWLLYRSYQDMQEHLSCNLDDEKTFYRYPQDQPEEEPP